jgi:hypothetical protein
MRQMVLTWEIGARDERREAQRDDGPQDDDERGEEIEPRYRDGSDAGQAPEPPEALEAIGALPQHQGPPQIQRPNLGLSINPALVVQQAEEERANEEMRESRQEMIEKKKHYQNRMLGAVNIPQLNSEQMKRVKQGLKGLFTNEINPLLAKFKPKNREWEEWQAFDGAYEEAMHLLREHVITAIGRDPQRLYGEKRINPAVQAAREQEAEAMIGAQTTRRELARLKDLLHGITDPGQEEGGRADDTTAERMKGRFTKRMARLLQIMPTETFRGYLGTHDHRAIWEELNTSQDNRERTIEWLDAVIATCVGTELKGVNARA